ncbi:hypothetical protein JYP46_21075 [Nitratireductor aquimarinus]|uniref:hypothetical protein n=1 Tax=Alphaproteobacteria TaxID=28211 RepID=UPI0019D39E08|nr:MULTISPECIES: hypothetical protein [Alphaproteobacteria]MBN7759324.1 hypothetical protein [Nitratireductor aquimarinus]MBY6001604.1 hypothetical protein [Tritonibacter mobilis]MBY6023892.1 hypothetical protein [Nitratireductor sp. DP7N14-4]
MSEENKSRLEGAIEQLRNHQTQLDADGIMVGVSREALDMALAALSAPKAEAETLPCDVQLPGALLRKGVSMDTLMFALKRREGWSEEDTRLRAASKAEAEEPFGYVYEERTPPRFTFSKTRIAIRPEDANEYELSETPVYTVPVPVPALTDEAVRVATEAKTLIEQLVNAKALRDVRQLVAGWNGEDHLGVKQYERHPKKLGATLPKTTCGAIYELDEVMQRARDFLNQKGSGEERVCVNCGRTRPSSEGRETPHPDCTSPDACTWDMTSDEAWQYWSQKYHDLARTTLTDEAVERAIDGWHKALIDAADEDVPDRRRRLMRAALLAAFPSKGEGE